MWTVFAELLLLPSPNSQSELSGGTPPLTLLVKDTVRGIVPSLAVAVISTISGGGGGGGRADTMTVAVRLADRFPVSITSIVTLYVPGAVNRCCSVALCDHGVSQTPSVSQSQRTCNMSAESSWSNDFEVNVKTVVVFPVAGVKQVRWDWETDGVWDTP